MTKREHLMRHVLEGAPGPHAPAAFFLHFPPDCRSGRRAVDIHLDYFRSTGNDIMKIQYEHNYPPRSELAGPPDWKDIPCYDEEFYDDQLEVVGGIVDAVKREAIVLVTLYSAFMFAGQMAGGQDRLVRHLEDDPEAVARGLDIITESMLVFIRGCIARGVDGFYASSQGGESGRFSRPDIFPRYVRPYELRIWEEIDANAALNILHVCDYELPYDSLTGFTDYPGDIVSAPLQLTSGRMTPAEVSRMFGRPFLGGMERLGPLSTGPRTSVEREAADALRDAPPTMILGADCTLSADADWANVAAAVSIAHQHETGSRG